MSAQDASAARAQALVSQLNRARFTGTITVLSNRDDTPEELLELALLPQVSVPIAHGTRPAATAEPEPDELPPLHREGFHGFRPGPVRLHSPAGIPSPPPPRPCSAWP